MEQPVPMHPKPPWAELPVPVFDGAQFLIFKSKKSQYLLPALPGYCIPPALDSAISSHPLIKKHGAVVYLWSARKCLSWAGARVFPAITGYQHLKGGSAATTGKSVQAKMGKILNKVGSCSQGQKQCSALGTSSLAADAPSVFDLHSIKCFRVPRTERPFSHGQRCPNSQ